MSRTALALPPALLDLTLSRVLNPSATSSTIGGVARWQRLLGHRSFHQAASLDSEPPQEYDLANSNFTAAALSRRQRKLASGGSYLVVRGGGSERRALHPLEKLGQQVQALDTAIQSDALSVQEFHYSEEELMAIYQDVLAVPIPEPPEHDEEAAEAARIAVAKAETEEDMRLLQGIEDRLGIEQVKPDSEAQPIPLHRRILNRAHEIISRAREARVHANPDAESKPFSLPIGVLTVREYEALVRTSMNANDYAAGEIALDIAKSANLPFPEEALTKILKTYTVAGNARAADKLLSNFLKDTPNELQRHLHVQAHLNATPRDELPTSAIKLLHHYESQNACVAMQTYTTVIAALYSRPLAVARAYAWDLFSHMRYVAHPNPDAVLYTLMIRACASPVSKAQSSEPEKALDLWTEMTVDHNIPPTVGSYNAVILACAKSGEKQYINEAFRLTKQMLDAHRDARGYSAFRPDRKTFCALLEGTKRIGDLARARWILAEIVKSGQDADPNAVEVEVDAEIMTHLFHTYAAYKPPFIRAATKVLPDTTGATASASSSKERLAQGSEKPSESTTSTGLMVEEETESPSFARIPPQSHSEVIHEVKFLFSRILQDRGMLPESSSSPSPLPVRKFGKVELNPRLIGAYLSVFYNHASLEVAQKLFNTIFDELNVTRIPRLYVEALERCMNTRKGPEREVALRFSDELWEQWTTMENAARDSGKPITARFVERAHIARIRMLAIMEDIDRAMEHLREFGAKYPPEVIKSSAPTSPLYSNKVSLAGERPLVRMTSAAEIPDDYVPPLIVFRDVDVLHHRLLVEERKKDIGFVTWLCKSYEWALRMRRNKAMQVQTGTKNTDIIVQAQ
ncbi:hypothetical protein CPC08DRAFT_662543 [Agrocybe pediades]|nr:hypothetical protein CPC08DRAFT_662543 [Agrocybe pediades]